MENILKLNEVCKLVGLHRRTIQKYLEKGVLKKPEKGDYGHFKYTESDIENLWELKFYHELGYNITEIEKILDQKKLDTYSRRNHFQQIEDELNEKKKEIEKLISIAQIMKFSGNDFNTFHQISSTFLSFTSFEDTADILSACSEFISNPEILDTIIDVDILNENLANIVFDLFESILFDCDNGVDLKKKQVQSKIYTLHRNLENICSNSVMFLKILLDVFMPSNEYEKDIQKERLDYLKNSIKYYYVSNIDNEYDNSLLENYNKLIFLYRNGFKPTSHEVQEKIGYIYNFYTGLKIIKRKELITFFSHYLNALKKSFSDEEYVVSFYDYFLLSLKIYYFNNFIRK